ncbi:MAG: preprotein translocase subunit SecE [Clostridia bacterium]|nr:preprotein translocase subunit SecE [Clostridia bacterium]
MADEVKDLKEVKEPKKEIKKESKPKNLQKNFAKFFKEVKAELKKVIWPTMTQLRNNTLTVLLFCVIIGFIIWAVDIGLNEVIVRFLKKQ